jgi:LPXTG-motif cell wall-anchored protein
VDGGQTFQIGGTKATQKGAYVITGVLPATISLGEHLVYSKSGSVSGGKKHKDNAPEKRYETHIRVVPATGSTSASTIGSLLAAWVALLGVIGGFVLSSRRRRRPGLAVAEGEIPPQVDTSGFVPTLRRPRGRKGASGGDDTGPARGTRPPGHGTNRRGNISPDGTEGEETPPDEPRA